MTKSKAERADEPTPDLLVHLERALGWTEARALDALGAYLLSTEAGRRLGREQDCCNRAARAA
jgi:hypothetical protein